MSELNCDVVVLGLGPGGEQAARVLATRGLDVIGVEMALVGGECPFWGCTPSKLMVRPADLLAEARRVGELAGEATVVPDWGLVATRIREVTDDWHDHSHAEELEKAGVRLVRGHGRLDGAGRVVVTLEAGAEGDSPVDRAGEGPEEGEVVITASRGVVLNTGTEPARLPIEGLDRTPYWTNREVMTATSVPERLVVVGGGPNGAELAQAFGRFGAHVTLLEASDRILTVEEPEAGAVLAEVLGREGVDVRTGVDIERVDHVDGVFRLVVDGEVIEGDELLVAAGRHLNLDTVGLASMGLEPVDGALPVDERMRAADKLWAIGDITGKGAFTHVSHYQATIATRDILGREGPWADYHAVSHVTFTDPEVGSVGLTERAAVAAGLSIAVGRADMSSSSRGWIHGPGNEGFVKLVADTDAGVLVGGSVMGPYAGEVMGLVAAAVHARIPLDVLREMHFAFPTFHGAVLAAIIDLSRNDTERAPV